MCNRPNARTNELRRKIKYKKNVPRLGLFNSLEERIEVVEHRLASGPLANAVTVEGVTVGGVLF